MSGKTKSSAPVKGNTCMEFNIEPAEKQANSAVSGGNTFHKYADNLKEQGYSVVPIGPGVKHPQVYEQSSGGRGEWKNAWNWQHNQYNAEQARFWPECGIGIRTGEVIAIDIDILDEAIASKAAQQFIEELGPTPLCRIWKHPKRQLIYRTDIPFSKMKMGQIEVLAQGQQFVAYGIHPETGAKTQWVGDGSPEDTAVKDLPTVTEDQVRAALMFVNSQLPSGLRGDALSVGLFNGEPRTSTSGVGAQYTIDGNRVRGTEAGLRAVMPFIPNADLHWDEWNRVAMLLFAATNGSEMGLELFERFSQQSPKHNPKTTADKWATLHRSPPKSSPGMSSLVWEAQENGWGYDVHPYADMKDGSQIPLDKLLRKMGVEDRPEDRPAMPLQTAPEAPTEVLEYEEVRMVRDDVASDVGVSESLHGVKQVAAGSVKHKKFAPAFQSSNIRSFPLSDFPDELTSTDGLLASVINYIVSTSRFPNRALALGAAIGVVGTLAGQGLAGPTASNTTTFVINIAATGGGKDRPLKAAGQILRDSGFPHLTGPGDFMSQTAVITTLKKKPCVLCCVDEIGSVLKKINSPRAGSHEKMVPVILRNLWGTSFGVYTTPAWAQIESEDIVCPALSILGATTPNEFTDALSSSDAENGTLNRFLIVRSTIKAREQNPKIQPYNTPAEITDEAQAVWRFCHPETDKVGVLAKATQDLPSTTPKRELVWADGAEAIYQELGRIVEHFPESMAEISARTREQGVRLASIRAAGRQSAEVTIDDMKWGAEVALHSTFTIYDMLKDNLAETPHQVMYKQIAKIIRTKGSISRTELTNKLDGKYHSRQIKDVIEDLAESGKITNRQVDTGGRPKQQYEWVNEVKLAA
jgi:hypothetical protein